jgi:hypothetical protein
MTDLHDESTHAETVSGTKIIGKVGSPPQREATSEQFQFWIPRDELVEKTQIVRTESTIGGQTIQYYALVDEVYRQSRKRNMGEEFDNFDGDVEYQPVFQAEGVTFAAASILRTEPPVLTPPLEQSSVYLGGEHDAQLAYGADRIENPLVVGLVKNGGSTTAGPGVIDLDYLLGVNGGHMNVNGSAGRGTKSSFLLFTIYQLLAEAHRRHHQNPSSSDPLLVAPIILNVKGFDLFHIHRRSNRFKNEKHLADWNAIDVNAPQAFVGTTFYAPQMPGGAIPVQVGGNGSVQPYSWSIANIIEHGLLIYLFADEDTNNANFSALVQDLESWLTQEQTNNDGTITRSLRTERNINTFQELLNWVTTESNAQPANRNLQGHETATWRKLRRRLLKLVYDGNGVLRRDDQHGNPLNVVSATTREPIVIDLSSLARVPSLQRFVVATILRQLVDSRTGPNAVRGLVYLVALDELNRFAPRGSSDPITELIELVAAEMRSQGIILLGAQQQASKVSDRVIENAAIRVLGCSGSLELSQPVWRFLSDSARRKAASLPPEEKLVIQDNFREPMHVRVPFPAWAMRPAEVGNDTNTSSPNRSPEIDTY